jgi:dTDP-4-dehydrorhamnose 3,5-epimerase
MTQRFNFSPTLLEGLYVVSQKPIADNRGSFSRFFCAEEFAQVGLRRPIVQINHSVTKKKGTFRGFHFQSPPCAESKIVVCVRGRIIDIAIDLRKKSKTFLRWHAEELSEDNNMSLYIPNGFAHGFQALEDDCELIYMHSEFYNPDTEGTINVLDPIISIKLPLDITQISERDKNHPMIETFKGVDVL